RAGNLRQRRRTALTHRHQQLRAQNVQDALNALLSESSKSVNIGSPDPDGARAQRQSFIDVGTAPESAIHHDLHLMTRAIDHFRKAFDRGAQIFGGASSMVRHHNAIDPMFPAQPAVFAGLDALENELHSGQLSQAIYLLPGRPFGIAAVVFDTRSHGPTAGGW